MRRWERAISTLFLSVALLMVSGCGGGGGTTPPPPPGTAPMTLFIRDAGAEKLLAFEIQLTGAALVSGTTEQSILAAPVELELKNLQLATMPLSLSSVRDGTYTTLRLTFANPEATVLTSTPTVVKCETGAACVPSLAAGPLNKTVNINVQLNVRSAVIIDFDLAASVNVTENPLAVAVNPAVNVTQVPVQAQQAEAELEDIVGTVTAIDGANQSFTFRPEGMTATFNIVTNAQTKFEDFDDASPARANAFASIRVNDLVEVDAEQRADGEGPKFAMTRVEDKQRSPRLDALWVDLRSGDELPLGFFDLTGLLEGFAEQMEVPDALGVLLTGPPELIDRALEVAQGRLRKPHVHVRGRVLGLAAAGFLQVTQCRLVIAQPVTGDAEIVLRLVKIRR